MLRWKVGDVTITRVLELCAPFPPQALLPKYDGERVARHLSWLQPHFVDGEGRLRIAIQALAVECRGTHILVDTCVGNGRKTVIEALSNLTSTFLEDLAAAGHPRESVDLVLCTHLHFDHVGWNTMRVDAKWVPTFPNARYLFAREEYEHWAGSDDGTANFRDTVQPVVEEGLHELVETDHRIGDEIWLEPTPGHTPGHVSVRISSRGRDAVITGDMVHHPVQLAEPEWGTAVDTNPAQAVRTRREFFARYAHRPTLVIGSHFAEPTAGRIVRDGEAWRFEV